MAIKAATPGALDRRRNAYSRANSRGVETVYEGTEHGADSGTYDLSPKLCLGCSPEQMTGLQVLH